MMRRWIALALTALLIGTAAAAQDVHVLPLPAADTLRGAQDILVTVPLADAAALEAQALPLAQRAGVAFVADWPLISIGLHCFVMRARDPPARDAAILLLSADPLVRSAQPVQTFETVTGEDGTAPRMFSRFDLRSLQDNLDVIDADGAHRYATGSGVTVGIIDTTVDFTHPALAAGAGVSRDFVASEAEGGIKSAARAETHGTAVAGVIAANGVGPGSLRGVAPDAQIIGLRSCWQAGREGRCNSLSIARALNYAMLQRIQVLNISLAGPDDPLIAQLIAAAIAQGIVIIAAAGNGGSNGFPGSIPGVIAARPMGQGPDGTQDAGGSVPAPGADVLSTAPAGGYDFYSGSSIAAAHVSGLAALVLQHHGQFTPDALRNRILAAIVHVDGQPPTLDACRAVAPRPQDCLP